MDKKIHEDKIPELKFRSKEVNDDDIKWGDIITSENESFFFDHSAETLKTGEILVPVFVDEELLGIHFVDETKHEPITHQTYANYVNFKVLYKRKGIIKIEHQFGVQVLKHTEEKHLNPIILKSQEYHFIFNKEVKKWKFLSDTNVFDTLKAEIEKERISPKVRNATRSYFAYRKENEKDVLIMRIKDNITYKNNLGLWRNFIDSMSAFHFNKYDFCEINETHYLLLNDKIQDLSDSLHILERKTAKMNLLEVKKDISSDVQRNIILDYSDFLVEMKRYVYTPAYWIIEGETYPNISELYELSQKAKYNRNEQSKLALKRKLLETAKKKNVNYINLSDLV